MGEMALRARIDLPRDGGPAGRAKEQDGPAQRPPPHPERERVPARGTVRLRCSGDPRIPGAPAMMKVSGSSKTLGMAGGA